MQISQEDRPPYVQWELRTMEDRNASIAAGHYVGKDVAFAIIMRPGSKDKVEKLAETWLEEISLKARNGELPSLWSEAFKASYKAWKDGEEEPVSGTPLKLFAVLSPSQLKTLISAGVKSVEDLAQLPDQELQQITVGGIGLKIKARAWLLQANDAGKLAEENAALQVKVEALQEQLTALSALVANLQKPESKA